MIYPHRNIKLSHADGNAAATTTTTTTGNTSGSGNNAAMMANAGSGEGTYAFKTLWQEITNGISSIGNTIVNGLQVTEKTEQLHDLYDIKGRQDWSLEYIEKTKGNSITTILFAIIVLALIIGVIILAVNKQKH